MCPEPGKLMTSTNVVCKCTRAFLGGLNAEDPLQGELLRPISLLSNLQRIRFHLDDLKRWRMIGSTWINSVIG